MTENAAAAVPAPAEPVASPADGLAGMLNILIDPAAAARRITRRLFWIYPIVLMVVMAIVQQIIMAPYNVQITRRMLQDRGMSADQIQAQTAMMSKFAFIGYIVAPIF